MKVTVAMCKSIARQAMSVAARVEHIRKSMQFVIKLGGSIPNAHLDYQPVPGNEKVLDFYHTFVPSEAGGKGLAKVLVEAGFKYAGDEGFKVRPTCSYIAKFVEKGATAEQINVVEDEFKPKI